MEIKADRERGHIALVRGAETVVTFADLGPVLHVWQYGSGVELDPDAARSLGTALTEWADREAVRQQRSA
jgi:hypothetical protein